jgi:hypothetical protein
VRARRGGRVRGHPQISLRCRGARHVRKHAEAAVVAALAAVFRAAYAVVMLDTSVNPPSQPWWPCSRPPSEQPPTPWCSSRA